MTDICLWSSSDSLACCSGFPLPASSVHPCWPFCIQQSAGRRPGGLVEAVCKEVQHQAFCQIRPGLQVGLTHRRAYKQKQAGETKGGFLREICDARTYKYTSCIQKHHDPVSLALFLLRCPPRCIRRVSSGLQFSSHINQLHSSNIKTMHNGGCLCLMCARASTDMCLIILGCF